MRSATRVLLLALKLTLLGNSMTNWTEQQKAIFKEIETGTKHVAVIARAGTGKTSTMVEAVNRFHASNMGKRVLAVAFNKSIATELAERMPVTGVMSSTLHSFGNSVMRRKHKSAYNGSKSWDIADKVIDEFKAKDKGKAGAIPWSFKKHITLASAAIREQLGDLNDAAAITTICDAREVLPPEANKDGKLLDAFITMAIMAVKKSAEMVDQIDFTDMIWLPIYLNLPIPKFDLVLVDEVQDMNPAQMEMMKRTVKPKGRLVVIGDDRQAIYGFRGADSKLMHAWIDEQDAQVYKLSKSFRCPTSVIKQAQNYVPDIEAMSGAKEGKVTHLSSNFLFDRVKTGDMVLSRTNAPLFKLYLNLLKMGRPAEYLGKDFAKQLVSILKGKEKYSIDEFFTFLSQYKQDNTDLIMAGREEWRTSRLAALEDRLESLYAILEAFRTPAAALQFLGSINQKVKQGIILSTAHRSKGLENPRVFLLMDTFKDEGGEEENIKYVAITRAQEELIMVWENENAGDAPNEHHGFAPDSPRERDVEHAVASNPYL